MKAFHGYDECMDFGQLKILYGGMNGPHGVHVIIHGGDACQAIVEAFREAFPEHYPTRIDVCFDFQGDKAYDKLYGLALKTKRKFDIQCEKMGDWIDKKRGRSFKLGGKKSTYQAIIYEKGHEQRQKNVNPDAPLDWVRVSFGYIPPRNQGHGVEAPTGTDRTLWPVDGLPLRSPRSYLGPSGQARHPEQKAQVRRVR